MGKVLVDGVGLDVALVTKVQGELLKHDVDSFGRFVGHKLEGEPVDVGEFN